MSEPGRVIGSVNLAEGAVAVDGVDPPGEPHIGYDGVVDVESLSTEITFGAGSQRGGPDRDADLFELS